MEEETRNYLQKIEEKIDNLPTKEELEDVSESLQALIIMFQRTYKI